MTDLPHVVVGGRLPTEEHIRVFEAWNREHGQPTVWSVSNINLAVDWWNALPGNASESNPRDRLIAAVGAVPHVVAGDKPTDLQTRVMGAYMLAEDWASTPTPWAGRRLTAQDYNAAIDWWNARQEAEDDALAEAVAQAWHYPDLGEDES